MNWKYINWFQLWIDCLRVLKEKLLKVDSNDLKVNWFQLKPFLSIYIFWGLKGKSIESSFKWIESKLISIEILSYQ
jgi:hypothetical protein